MRLVRWFVDAFGRRRISRVDIIPEIIAYSVGNELTINGGYSNRKHCLSRIEMD